MTAIYWLIRNELEQTHAALKRFDLHFDCFACPPHIHKRPIYSDLLNQLQFRFVRIRDHFSPLNCSLFNDGWTWVLKKYWENWDWIIHTEIDWTNFILLSPIISIECTVSLVNVTRAVNVDDMQSRKTKQMNSTRVEMSVTSSQKQKMHFSFPISLGRWNRTQPYEPKLCLCNRNFYEFYSLFVRMKFTETNTFRRLAVVGRQFLRKIRNCKKVNSRCVRSIA